MGSDFAEKGDEKIENAAFEKEHVVLCLSHFFLGIGKGGETALAMMIREQSFYLFPRLSRGSELVGPSE